MKSLISQINWVTHRYVIGGIIIPPAFVRILSYFIITRPMVLFRDRVWGIKYNRLQFGHNRMCGQKTRLYPLLGPVKKNVNTESGYEHRLKLENVSPSAFLARVREIWNESYSCIIGDWGLGHFLRVPSHWLEIFSKTLLVTCHKQQNTGKVLSGHAVSIRVTCF